MELVSGEDIEITEQYVILQVIGDDGAPNIYGLWIFSEEDTTPSVREVVANAIQECAVRAEMASANATELQNEVYQQPEPYNLDGSTDTIPYEAAHPAVQPQSNQQVDLLSLFNKPSVSSNPSGPSQANLYTEPQPARFTPTADTDFFRSSNSPASVQQQSQRPPQSKNVLLDLFNSAKT